MIWYLISKSTKELHYRALSANISTSLETAVQLYTREVESFHTKLRMTQEILQCAEICKKFDYDKKGGKVTTSFVPLWYELHWMPIHHWDLQSKFERRSPQWIFSWIFASRRITCGVKIVGRKNDILAEIIKNCWWKMIK